METTTYTQDQNTQLVKALDCHRAHATDNDGWVSAGLVDAPGREWPAVVCLRYRGPGNSPQRAEFPGMTREALYAGIAAAGYFRTNLGGVDIYGPTTPPF